MKLNYLGKEKRISFWDEDIEWFSLSTRGKEDDMIDVFEKELILNVKRQLDLDFRCSEEDKPLHI